MNYYAIFMYLFFIGNGMYRVTRKLRYYEMLMVHACMAFLKLCYETVRLVAILNDVVLENNFSVMVINSRRLHLLWYTITYFLVNVISIGPYWVRTSIFITSPIITIAIRLNIFQQLEA
ncbi:PREDICTED: uncharacterized protein LOC108565860 isoform X2 [Nicrophorus vespilloides]|uniref:Uncharacterized protein LOC108565860 isoform X2 n=1 Tax=Nicrophorus vespilloides TaxID=110193 RepID=A0ABM1N2G0_NICVS|nr:PREDICTED: uncharacterized protein LOC108565860 isoform X2 [Nicrophorus vespilloides]